MWWELMQALKAHLQTQPGLSDIPIMYGECAATPEKDTLELVRGPEKPDDKLRNIRGEQTFYVQCWTYSTDTKFNDGYQQLAQLEQNTVAALQLFGRNQNEIAGLHVLSRVQTIEPDGDVFRPSVGSRIPLLLKWAKINK